MRTLIVAVVLLAGGCRGPRPPGSVVIGVPRYDAFFRDANAVLAEAAAARPAGRASPPPDERRSGEIRERARALGAQAMALLESLDAEVPERKQGNVRAALTEAAERLAAVP
ncbi:MAG: hypothetical protein AABZ30_09095 [Myxococcota bacterium]